MNREESSTGFERLIVKRGLKKCWYITLLLEDLLIQNKLYVKNEIHLFG